MTIIVLSLGCNRDNSGVFRNQVCRSHVYGSVIVTLDVQLEFNATACTEILTLALLRKREIINQTDGIIGTEY